MKMVLSITLVPLRYSWEIVGFRPDDCSAHYGFNLIKQAYEQSGGQNRRFTAQGRPARSPPPLLSANFLGYFQRCRLVGN
jgi:hypothetical protein